MRRMHARTLAAVRRADGSVEIRQIEALIRALGGDIEERGNGLYKAVLDDVWLIYDRPHPSPEIGRGMAKRLRSFLTQAGAMDR